MDFQALSAEFPRGAVHWRAQTLTRDGSKALALAYLDARDVMDRLDDVCGPENWQTKYVETAKGRVLCSIGIRCRDEWVWKSDGAGDTAVEGEKGAVSDSLKRAAVQWGIGRYLYRLDAVWVPCSTYERNGKKYFDKFTADPWAFVRQPSKSVEANPVERDPVTIRNAILGLIRNCRIPADLTALQHGEKFRRAMEWLRENDEPKALEIAAAANEALNAMPSEAA